MPNAPHDHQLRLLAVQDADLRIQQAQHRRATLPVLAQIDELVQHDRGLEEEAVARGTEVTDLRRAVAKAEDDVQSVRERAERDRTRLASSGTSAKDLQALQADLEILERRTGDLEDVELEAMESLETAEAAQAEVVARREDNVKRLRELEHERDITLRSIDQEIEETAQERAAAAEGLDAGLVSLYERLRDQHGGVGAAALQGTTCLGCHMALNPADLRAIENAPADQIVRCEECGRILVRKEGA